MNERALRAELEALQHERASLERELQGPSRQFLALRAAHQESSELLVAQAADARRESERLRDRAAELERLRLEVQRAWDRRIGPLPILTFALVGCITAVQLTFASTPRVSPLLTLIAAFGLGLLFGPRVLRVPPRWPDPRLVLERTFTGSAPAFSAALLASSWSVVAIVTQATPHGVVAVCCALGGLVMSATVRDLLARWEARVLNAFALFGGLVALLLASLGA